MKTKLKILQEDGRCRTEGNNDLFFSDRPADLQQAQQICSSCAVRVPCLEVALSERLEWGVWGGVIFWDGQPYHRRRGRGRPRMADSELPLEADRDDLLELVASA